MAKVIGPPLQLTCWQATLARRVSPHILTVYCPIKVELCLITKENVRNVIRGEGDKKLTHVQSAWKVLRQESLGSDHFVRMEFFLLCQALPSALRQAQNIASLRADWRMWLVKFFSCITSTDPSHSSCIGRSHCTSWPATMS